MKSLVRELTVSVGMSIDKNGVWVKAGTSLTVSVSEEDNKDLSGVFERAYEVAGDELNKELNRLGIEG